MMLLENAAFKTDVNLLAMDKEDALIVFEQHIRDLEREEIEERERSKRRQKRQQRKNRDQFLALLDSLHEEGKLTSMSLWVELYPMISADLRFSAMLGQGGSTPLDLFKFYVEDLKARFHDEKKIIKEILKDRGFEVKVETTFEQFATVVCEDRKSATLDAGNVKLTYNSLLEKAEAKERERQKEENKKLRKLESAFRNMLRDANVDHNLSFEEVKVLIEQKHEYRAVPSDSERERMYKEFQREMEEACSHHHSGRGSRKTSKKAKKSQKRHRNGKSSESDNNDNSDKEIHPSEIEEPELKRRARTPSSERSGSETLTNKKKKSKKSKYKRRSPSLTPPPPQDKPNKIEKKKARSHSDDSNPEKELSETELEQQRALLLDQLKELIVKI